MCGIRCAVGVQGIVSISVIGNDDSLITVSLGSLDNIVNAGINCNDSLLDCLINAGMTYHITVCKVYYDEVILVGADGLDQLVTNDVSAHLRLQVICGNLG